MYNAHTPLMLRLESGGVVSWFAQQGHPIIWTSHIAAAVSLSSHCLSNATTVSIASHRFHPSHRNT